MKMVSKPLVPFISKIKILFSLCSLIFLFFLLQVIGNYHGQNSTSFTTSPEIEKEYRKKYNLMDGPAEVGTECTLDYINELKLQQDHPCVIKLIRDLFMNPPSPPEVSYNYNYTIPNFHKGARNGAKMEKFFLKNKKNGFFIECGAFDGFFLSNTFELETEHSWTGLLIEASPMIFPRLLGGNRKAWKSNVCLSLMPYPTKISFTSFDSPVRASQVLFRIAETAEEEKAINESVPDPNQPFNITNWKTTKIQCFPFYSLLLASNRTTVDYFSLDIEGHEMRVLETVPWHKVDIKMMRVETNMMPRDKNNRTGSDALKEFLEGEPGYVNFKLDKADELYIQKNINQI